jgi:hypothetical protein
MKNKNNLDIQDFLVFLRYLDLAISFDIYQLYENEYEETAHKIKELTNTDIDELLNDFKSHEKVVLMDIYLPQNDFINISTKLAPENLKEQLVSLNDVTFCISMANTYFVISLFKVFVKRNRKTIQELEVELQNALKIEDYTTAIKLREKIKKRNNPQPRKNKQSTSN